MKLTKIISVSLSPNTERDDIWLALKTIFSFWKWKKGKENKIIEERFSKMFGFEAKAFNSGRTCLMVILEAINIQKNDEIIVQAFTCNAVINPILNKKAKPVFVDIDDSLNIDVDKIEKKISKKTKAVIIQHTFGYPAEIGKVKKICEKHNLYLIEDCAHSLGAKYKGKLCGSFGDVSFFSFGRDKVISSVYGGMVVIKNKDLAIKIKEYQEKLEYPSSLWVIQQLLHPLLMNLMVLPLYDVLALGKIFLYFFVKTNILSKAVKEEENKGVLPDYFPKRMPNGLAILALNQLKKLDRFNNHRRKIASLYEKGQGYDIIFRERKGIEPIYLKYPVIVSNREEVIRKMKKDHIYLSDGWEKTVIVPPGTELKKMHYASKSCLKAEEIARSIVSLPTHINISASDARKIINNFN